MRARVEHGATSGVGHHCQRRAHQHQRRGDQNRQCSQFHLAYVDFFTQIFRGTTNHQPGNKHRQQDKQHHAVKAGTDAAEYHFTNLHQPHRHHATKSGKRIMHRNHRAAGSRRSHDRKQATDQHAETALFTFHIDAAVRAERQQMRITLNFCPHHYAYADDKNHRHRPQQHAPLATIARHFTKGKAQRCWDQENRQHLHEVGQCGWVFKRMRRVGIKKATAVSSEHFDRFLRSYWPHW